MPTRLKYIDSRIQYGRGRAASVVGETYNVFRLSDSTDGSISSGSPVLSNFPVETQITRQRNVIENESFSLEVYEAKCDNRALVVGDVLQQYGYKSDGRVYTYVQQRPSKATLFMRTEFNAFISRPYPGAGNPEQQSASWTDSEDQGAIAKSGEQVLVLSNGVYSFESAGASPAGVYVGMQQLNRIRDGKGLGTPTDLPEEHFLFYVPVLPGEQIERKDRINLGNSDRYEVLSVYTSDQIGLTGNIIIAGMLGT